MENTEKQFRGFYERMQILHSDECIRKLWNEYVIAYNKKRLSLADMLAISERQAGQMERIEKALDGAYGFTMDAWELIKHAGYKQNVKAFQLWIERNGFTRQQFNDAFTVICQESKRYYQMHIERGIIEIITQIIRENSFPERIDTWDELTEAEREQVKTGRPKEFDEKETLKWYYELKKQKEFQKKNGEPHKTKIKKEIIKRFEQTLGFGPSMSLMDNHFRDLDLT